MSHQYLVQMELHCKGNPLMLFIMFPIETNLGASCFQTEGLLTLGYMRVVALQNIIISRVKAQANTLAFHEQLGTVR